MSSIIAFVAFALLAILNAVFATAMLQGKQWKLFDFGNPVMANGQYLYNAEKRRHSTGILVASYAVAFGLTAVATLLTQVSPVIPSGFLTAALYLHGTVLILGAVCNLAYLDNCCQNEMTEQMGETLL